MVVAWVTRTGGLPSREKVAMLLWPSPPVGIIQMTATAVPKCIVYVGAGQWIETRMPTITYQ